MGYSHEVSGRYGNRTLFFFLCAIFSLFMYLNYLINFDAETNNFSTKQLHAIQSSRDHPSFLGVHRSIHQSSDANICHLPNLNPFDSSILQFVHGEKLIDCTQNPKRPFKLQFQIQNNTLIASSESFLNSQTCCYQVFDPTKIDNSVKLPCNQITTQRTHLPETAEFIRIFCSNKIDSGQPLLVDSNLIDLLANIPYKFRSYEFTDKNDVLADYDLFHELKPDDKSRKKRGSVNIVVLGLDAVSHLNFQRTLPRTRQYLMEIMSALYLNGYTKLGDNTFPNLVPALIGLSVDELMATCWPTRKSYFDACPFIWKNYSRAGYQTAFAEDSISMATFHYVKKAFKNPPTNYYLHDFMREAERKTGHTRRGNSLLCYGPRAAYKILLDYVKEMAVKMGSRHPYFQFVWTSSVTHDDLNKPNIMDNDILTTLRFLFENGHLSKTVLVVMSDHGIRYGKIRETFQGKVEENMPFLYVHFPAWFRLQYPLAIANFKSNQQKLTTHFDFHEILLDLLNLSSIQNQELHLRQKHLTSKLPRGISLFLSIPANRSCEDAAVKDSFCVCHATTTLSLQSPAVLAAAQAAVRALNTILLPYSQCSQLTLVNITSAYDVELQGNRTDLIHTKPKEYVVIFVTSPSNAIFEATLTNNFEANIPEKHVSAWKSTGDISRVNIYGDQSRCVDDYNMKKYCYCS